MVIGIRICDTELSMWLMHFGSPASLNEINFLDKSITFMNIRAGEFPLPSLYKIKGNRRPLPYYLSDDIYPSCEICIKSIQQAASGSNEKVKSYISHSGSYS